MVSTFGLTHLVLRVPDVERAFEFYEAVFGMVAVFRSAEFLQAQTPGARDVLVFERAKGRSGKSGSIAHFGFRLTDPRDLGAAASAVVAAGGIIEEQGEFVPGEPYLFARDRDGFLIEIWYELPTSLDPKPKRNRRPAARHGARTRR
jgi:catechol 2,3-dioxygenase-like lactoylglutathione lyase family enzyme